MKKVDFFIVGQGIAGTILSHQLINKGYNVKVFDIKKSNSASRIAAGVFNPVAYRKLKKAEFAHFLIPEMITYYTHVEEQLGISFYKPTSFLKILTDFEEYNNWQIQCAKETNRPFMSDVVVKENFNEGIKNPFGAGQVLQSGVINLPLLIDTWKDHLKKTNSLMEEFFQYDKLQVLENCCVYEGVESKKVVFCEGVGVSQNPWFDWLPMQKFKGEVLEIYAPKLQLDRMINRGVFLLPRGNGYFKVGATHDWRNVDEIPTEQGKNELLEKLNRFINVPYEITNHTAGLRPAARDRHPYIGVHPEHNNLLTVNGLGSKGVIMAPWLIKEFIKGIDSHKWPKEFDINRYIRFYKERKNNEKN
ncbi:MAG: NAD(P)/FAD-dependent oxidoreductase [Salibacteraceae bacterium]